MTGFRAPPIRFMLGLGTDKDGNLIRGAYDKETDLIAIDLTAGRTRAREAVIHELLHAATRRKGAIAYPHFFIRMIASTLARTMREYGVSLLINTDEGQYQA